MIILRLTILLNEVLDTKIYLLDTELKKINFIKDFQAGLKFNRAITLMEKCFCAKPGKNMRRFLERRILGRWRLWNYYPACFISKYIYINWNGATHVDYWNIYVTTVLRRYSFWNPEP